MAAKKRAQKAQKAQIELETEESKGSKEPEDGL
jgi:hypothetical protein